MVGADVPVSLCQVRLIGCGRAALEAERSVDLSLDAVGITGGRWGVAAKACGRLTLRDCAIDQSTIGVRAEATAVRASHCRLRSCGSSGMSLVGVEQALVESCEFVDNGHGPYPDVFASPNPGAGVQLAIGAEGPVPCRGVHVSGSSFQDEAWSRQRPRACILVDAATGTLIWGNTFPPEVAPRFAVAVRERARFTTVLGNHVMLNPWDVAAAARPTTRLSLEVP